MEKDEIGKQKTKDSAPPANYKLSKPKNLASLYAVLLLLFAILGCTVDLGDDEQESNNSSRTIETKAESNSKTSNRRNSQTKADEIDESSANPRVPICKRYDACGCQSYESCLETLENDTTPDDPGILECVLKSSCESLCRGKPDGCPNRKTEAPQRSNCSQIRCSKDSDCPGDCHGGCSEGVCYMF